MNYLNNNPSPLFPKWYYFLLGTWEFQPVCFLIKSKFSVTSFIIRIFCHLEMKALALSFKLLNAGWLGEFSLEYTLIFLTTLIKLTVQPSTVSVFLFAVPPLFVYTICLKQEYNLLVCLLITELYILCVLACQKMFPKATSDINKLV